MNYIYFFLLLGPLLIFLFLYPKNNPQERFQSNQNNLQDMFDELEQAENMCAEIEEKERLQNKRDEFNHNMDVRKEMELLDTSILELKDMVAALIKEKFERTSMANQCRASKQQKINDVYEHIQELQDDIPNSIEMELEGLDDIIAANQVTVKKTNANCEKKDPELFVPLIRNKEGLQMPNGSTCYNCNLNPSPSLQNKIANTFK